MAVTLTSTGIQFSNGTTQNTAATSGASIGNAQFTGYGPTRDLGNPSPNVVGGRVASTLRDIPTPPSDALISDLDFNVNTVNFPDPDEDPQAFRTRVRTKYRNVS